MLKRVCRIAIYGNSVSTPTFRVTTFEPRKVPVVYLKDPSFTSKFYKRGHKESSIMYYSCG